jgi:hypothetical protein
MDFLSGVGGKKVVYHCYLGKFTTFWGFFSNKALIVAENAQPRSPVITVNSEKTFASAYRSRLAIYASGYERNTRIVRVARVYPQNITPT